VIDVYAKNLPKDAVALQLTGEDDKLKITIAAQPPAAAGASSSQAEQQQPGGDDEEFVLEFDLFSKVVPGENNSTAAAAAVATIGLTQPGRHEAAAAAAAAAAKVPHLGCIVGLRSCTYINRVQQECVAASICDWYGQHMIPVHCLHCLCRPYVVVCR
jgi:hypothetical protein